MSDAGRILAYDLGTGGTKASLYGADGDCLASAFVSYDTLYPAAGWHEQRPDDWWDAVVASTRQLLAARPGAADEVACLAISGQSLAVVPVDSQGALLRQSTPIWSDTRASAQMRAFFSQVDAADWYMKTGAGFPPECYSVLKAMWYRDNEPAMFRRVHRLLGSKDYINYRLTGRMLTDHSYASGCGAYALRAWGYSDDLLAASGLPREIFPEIVPSTQIIGTLTREAAAALGLRTTVQVAAGGVDNSCMALGARNTRDGRVYTSLGSSAWIAVSSTAPVLDVTTKPYVFAHVVPGLYTSAVSIFAGGSAFRWARDVLGMESYEAMNEMAARSPVGARGLLFNPSLAGGSSQEPSPNIRGGFYGLDLMHTRDDLVRAVMEGVAMNLGAVLAILRGLVRLDNEMLMVGGGSKSALWRRIFADVYGMRIIKTNIDQEAAALGAAALAAVGSGMWKDFGRIDDLHRVQSTEEPDARNVKAYAELMRIFERARQEQAAISDMLLGVRSASGQGTQKQEDRT